MWVFDLLAKWNMGTVVLMNNDERPFIMLKFELETLHFLQLKGLNHQSITHSILQCDIQSKGIDSFDYLILGRYVLRILGV